MREKEKERLRLVRAFNEEWSCPHYVILGHFSKKRDQKESHPPRFLFFVSFCSQKDSREFLRFFSRFCFIIFYFVWKLFRFPISSFFIEDTFIYRSSSSSSERERERERKIEERERQSTKIRERVERQPLSRRFEENRVGFL